MKPISTLGQPLASVNMKTRKPEKADFERSDICAVPAGSIIGTAIAHDLQKRGRAVVLIDRDAPGRGASFGNMASIAVTEFMPASRPSI